ncbi:hypothetical protein MLD38_022667 [Melastoma candidum]|uniref:Uncharacterized protein n=1 Tax=Melastoma candidum TaxID=119954 RepID=A0ACB9QJW5_9MYRT|nr:hypothetical protein MLD38_022667 [Melastoma candidum]
MNKVTINENVEPQVVWSANRDRPVGINSTLELTHEDGLVVKDADGSVAWLAEIPITSAVAMNLTDGGNLKLLDRDNVTIWQSFDHPSDTLLPGQILRVGQKLTQSISSANWTNRGMLSLSLNAKGLLASVESDSTPPLVYYQVKLPLSSRSNLKLVNGSLDFSEDSGTKLQVRKLPYAWSTQFLKLDRDGHLRLYEFQLKGVVEKADLFPLDVCQYPTICGYYGLCSNGSCSSITSSDNKKYFKRRDRNHPNQGFYLKKPLICGDSKNQTYLEIANVEYFKFFVHLTDVDVEICKDTCMKNCSCKAVFFRVSPDNNRSSCFLPSEVFSLINVTGGNGSAGLAYTIAYIKVQKDVLDFLSPPTSVEAAGPKKYLGIFTKVKNAHILLAFFFVAATITTLLVVGSVLKKKKKKKIKPAKDLYVEENVEQIPVLPTRFTYAELEEITEKFSKKLGEGGFGSVYEGVLPNKMKVAVKCIDGFERTKKSFLTEVKTIGSIHHANILRLLGFCAENSYRMLVYEYMSNSSLDKWIFNKFEGCTPLKWEQRRKIVLDVAKGLHYLHEECTLKIVHFDIKPQNILLDDNLRAKVSDFGMSKLINRDESRILTVMRGTRGYLAPEWLNGLISEKVDVYSFGVVILEILCGRKAFSHSNNGDAYTNLLDLLKTKSKEGLLSDMIDETIEEADNASAAHMLKVAAWCLQVDYSKRPSMPMVIKVLEGATDVREDDIDYDFGIPSSSSLSKSPHELGIILNANAEESAAATASLLLPSVLSGPR